MRLERACGAPPHTEHDARIVAGAAKEKREHGGPAQARVPPDPSTAAQDPVDVKGQVPRDDALSAVRNAREPRERAIGGEELEGARNDRAGRHDLELRAQPHASERGRRSQRAAVMHHLPVYEGTLASADTLKWIHMPLGACPGTPHAIRYSPAGEALKVV
jgi:hypothetical protein